LAAKRKINRVSAVRGSASAKAVVLNMPHQKLNRVLNYVWLLVAFPVAVAIPGFARPSAGGSSGGVASGKYRVSIRNFSNFSVGVRPFLPSTLPRKLAAFFTFDSLVLPDLFFDKVGDPVERIGIHYGRDRNVFFSL